MMRPELIALDVDGVLRDISRLIYECHRRSFSEYYKNGELEEIINIEDLWHFKGLGKYNSSTESIKAFRAMLNSGKAVNLHEIVCRVDAEQYVDSIVQVNITDDDLAIVEEMRKRYVSFFKSKAAKKLAYMYPNVLAAMDILESSGIKTAIVTNSFRDSIERDIPAKMLKKFSSVVTRDDLSTQKLKPSGEGLLLTASKLGVNPKKMAYIGDTIVDVYAAKDAGCLSVSLLGGMGLKQHLANAKTDLIYSNLYEAVYELCKK